MIDINEAVTRLDNDIAFLRATKEVVHYCREDKDRLADDIEFDIMDEDHESRLNDGCFCPDCDTFYEAKKAVLNCVCQEDDREYWERCIHI